MVKTCTTNGLPVSCTEIHLSCRRCYFFVFNNMLLVFIQWQSLCPIDHSCSDLNNLVKPNNVNRSEMKVLLSGIIINTTFRN
jgi:hypothetical protein